MILAIAIAAFLQDDSRKEWEGFAEGSFVTRRVTQTEGEKQGSVVQRFEVRKNEADSVLLRVEQGRASKEQSVSIKKDPAYKKIATESVDVAGKTFTCAVWEKTIERGKEKQTIKQWICKDVPGRLAKIDILTKADGGEMRASGRLTRLDQRLQLGAKAITYAVYEFSGRTDDGREMTAVRWISEQVPGFTVRQEERAKRDTKEVTQITELVDFETK